jgi:hypothetical protein
MLKAVPNKNAGFIILLTSIFTFFFFGEIRNLTALCLLNNNGFSLSSFFLCSLSFLWIGAQFPQEKFLSYARILTLHYYFLLMCILFSIINCWREKYSCECVFYLQQNIDFQDIDDSLFRSSNRKFVDYKINEFLKFLRLKNIKRKVMIEKRR